MTKFVFFAPLFEGKLLSDSAAVIIFMFSTLLSIEHKHMEISLCHCCLHTNQKTLSNERFKNIFNFEIFVPVYLHGYLRPPIIFRSSDLPQASDLHSNKH